MQNNSHLKLPISPNLPALTVKSSVKPGRQLPTLHSGTSEEFNYFNYYPVPNADLIMQFMHCVIGYLWNVLGKFQFVFPEVLLDEPGGVVSVLYCNKTETNLDGPVKSKQSFNSFCLFYLIEMCHAHGMSPYNKNIKLTLHWSVFVFTRYLAKMFFNCRLL